MEKFYELCITGKESALHKILAQATIISLFLAAGIFIFLNSITTIIFLVAITLPLFVCKRLSMVEYDYEFTDGELEIGAIYERVRRKVKGNINLRDIEIAAPLGHAELNRYSTVKVKKCYILPEEGKKVYRIVVRCESKMVAYDLALDQKMIDLFFFSNPQKVIR